jgi:two-component system cell cycle response regulator CpdR
LSAYGNGIMNKLNDVRDDTVQIIQKPFALSFLIRKIEGSTIKHKIVNTQDGNVLTVTQDSAAIR